MPRSGPNGTYTLPGAQATQQPGTPIPSAVNNQGYSDIEQTFNTVQPRAYGGTDSNDLKLNDANFGVRNNTDATKIGVFNAAGIPTGTTRTYDLPYYSGTLGLVSDIRGQIYGLTLSNNVTDATNDIDIAAGAAVNDTGGVSMLLASAMGKQLDVAWAVGGTPGAPQGMRASGAAIANTTYHIFLIRRPDTGVVDIAADTSATGANIAANTNAAYTQIRRIGSIVRKAGAILGFVQVGNEFIWRQIQPDLVAGSLGTLPTTYPLTVPAGINVGVEAKVATYFFKAATGATGVIYSSAMSSPTPGVSQNNLGTNSSAIDSVATVTHTLRTSSAGEVVAVASTAACTLYISTYGYYDQRGQDR